MRYHWLSLLELRFTPSYQEIKEKGNFNPGTEKVISLSSRQIDAFCKMIHITSFTSKKMSLF
jgi:hypothetical protein